MVMCYVKTESGEQKFGAVLDGRDLTDALVEGLHVGRGYQIGDRIYLDRQTIVITDFFTGVDAWGRSLALFSYSHEA